MTTFAASRTDTPAWVDSALDMADLAFDREADLLRRRLYEQALTEAMRVQTPEGLPELSWRGSRFSDGTTHIWAVPVAPQYCFLYEDETRQGAADLAAWLDALDGPALTERPNILGRNSTVEFAADRHVADVDFTLSFHVYTSDLGKAAIRRIVAEATRTPDLDVTGVEFSLS